MKLGDCPNIMFTPAENPVTGRLFTERTLIICNPYLYVYIRDLVIANEASQLNQIDQNAEVAMEKLMRELMKYKPRSQQTEGERKIGPLSIRLEEHYPNPNPIKPEPDNLNDLEGSS